MIQGYTERDIEQAVIERLYAEEETQDIQQMIAKFYNKFDELHEQSVSQALAKSPNREQLKNEVKYRIPDRWTKKFHYYDIVDINVANRNRPGILQERGRVNKPARVAAKKDIEEQITMKILKNARESKLQPLSQVTSQNLNGAQDMSMIPPIHPGELSNESQVRMQNMYYHQNAMMQGAPLASGSISAGQYDGAPLSNSLLKNNISGSQQVLDGK